MADCQINNHNNHNNNLGLCSSVTMYIYYSSPPYCRLYNNCIGDGISLFETEGGLSW